VVSVFLKEGIPLYWYSVNLEKSWQSSTERLHISSCLRSGRVSHLFKRSKWGSFRQRLFWVGYLWAVAKVSFMIETHLNLVLTWRDTTQYEMKFPLCLFSSTILLVRFYLFKNVFRHNMSCFSSWERHIVTYNLQIQAYEGA